MRVLFVTPSVSNVGGVEVFVKNLASHLIDHGVKVEVFSSESVPIIPIQGMKSLSFAFAGALYGHSKSRVAYDIIHAQNLPSAIISRSFKAKVRIATLHGVYAEQVALLHGRSLEGILRRVEDKFLRDMDALVAVSRDVEKHYKRRGFTIAYIPNGIDLDLLPSRERRYYEFQLVYVGRLSYEKGADLLIEAVKRLPRDLNLRLVVVGSGPMERKLNNMAYGDPRIIFIGSRDHATTLEIIRGSDLFLLPSRMEGAPMALLEAMALGVPVIASDVGGIPDFIENGVTGLLFRDKDIEMLKDAIIRLYENRYLAKTLAKNAIEKIKTDYSIERMATRYLDLYQELLN